MLSDLSLLAVGAWPLDVAFFVILAGGLIGGACLGFVRGICKIAGTIFSIVLAVACCVPLSTSLESAFGLETALAEAVKIEWLGKVLSVVICFIGLIVIVRLGAWFLGKCVSKLIDRFKPLKKVDRVFGAVLGLAEAALLIFILLVIVSWVAVFFTPIGEYFSSSAVVGSIYKWDWFVHVSGH